MTCEFCFRLFLAWRPFCVSVLEPQISGGCCLFRVYIPHLTIFFIRKSEKQLTLVKVRMSKVILKKLLNYSLRLYKETLITIPIIFIELWVTWCLLLLCPSLCVWCALVTYNILFSMLG